MHARTRECVVLRTAPTGASSMCSPLSVSVSLSSLSPMLLLFLLSMKPKKKQKRLKTFCFSELSHSKPSTRISAKNHCFTTVFRVASGLDTLMMRTLIILCCWRTCCGVIDSGYVRRASHFLDSLYAIELTELCRIQHHRHICMSTNYIR